MFAGHRWALGASGPLGCNRSIMGKKSMFMHMHQVLHFHRIYCNFCISWTFQSFVLTIQYSRYFRLLLNIRAFEQFLPCLMHWQLTDSNRVCCIYGWIRLKWLIVVQLTKQAFRMQCCSLAGIWVLVLQHCNKVMSTLHVSSFSCGINSQNASWCPLPTVLLGSCRVTFTSDLGLGFPVLQN